MAQIKNALKPMSGMIYTKRSPRKPLHERKEPIEFGVKMGAIIAIAQSKKCSLQEAKQILQIAMQNYWVEHQLEIVSTAYLDAPLALKNEQFFQDLQYSEADYE